jgi:hypothetical protein
MTIRIGQVSTRRGYRLHAITDQGRTRCGIGTGRVIATRDLTTTHLDLTCKRCRRHLRTEVEAALADATTATGNRYNPARIAALTTLANAFKTPTEQADDDLLAAQIAATIQAAPTVQPLPEQTRRRTWADLRREFTATHPQLPFAA